MRLLSLKVNKLLKKVPGAKTFGVYRFLPAFFVAGAALEYSMIHLTVGEVNFYTTFKKKRVEERVNEILSQEE